MVYVIPSGLRDAVPDVQILHGTEEAWPERLTECGGEWGFGQNLHVCEFCTSDFPTVAERVDYA